MSESSTKKMVPLSSLVEERKKNRARISELEEKLSDLETEMMAKTSSSKFDSFDDEDEAVAKIKATLIEQDKELQKREKELKKREAQAEERVRQATAKEAVLRLKDKGIEADEDELLNEDDIEAYAKNKLVEHLAKENEELKTKGSTEEATQPENETFESSSAGKSKIQIDSMTDQEFEKVWEQAKSESALK